MSARPPQPELLAPAGDFDAMRAAVANGANAVYFGLSNFNARHRATNFTLEELPSVMKYLHDHNVRGYVTFNTLIFSDELDDAVRLITAAANAAVDALIVQDLGVARLIRTLSPTLPVHGSTQMTLTEPRGIEFVKNLGVERVILARELSIPDIKCISQSLNPEKKGSGPISPLSPEPRTLNPQPPGLEVFIHGALCVAYSGQCLTSESLGGRSANRGQCAQACRLPYDLIVDGKHKELGDKAYLLSPQDLAAYDLIDDLVKLGVCSLKIEGRLKSAHYVAATTHTYRAALDAALAQSQFKISNQQLTDLAQSFSRGFTHGFLDGVNHQRLVHARFPKSRGIKIGAVTAKTSRGLIVQLTNSSLITHHSSLKPNDGLVFDEGHPEQDEQGGRIASVLPVRNRKDQLELHFHPGDVNLSAIAIGSLVWKTDDPAVRKRLEQTFSRDTVANPIKLQATVRAVVGESLRIDVRDDEGHTTTVISSEPMQRAEKFSLTEPLFRDQFGRLGNTPFTLGTVSFETLDPVMAPKSILNDLRRRAVDQLLHQRARRHPVADPAALATLRSHILSPEPRTPNPEPSLTVLARTMDQLRAILDWSSPTGDRPDIVYCDFEDIRRYKEAVALAREAQLPIALATLRIVKPNEEGLLRQIADCAPDAVLVRNLAAVSFYSQQTRDLPMLGDYSLNVANELTAQIFHDAGVTRMVPSYDLNWRQMQSMFSRFPASRFEAVVHQHMPMFHMEHCVFCHTLSTGTSHKDCGRPCDHHKVDLKDRVGQAHPLVADVGCRNTLFNATAQSAAEYLPRMRELGLRYFRIELLRENPQQTTDLLTRYARLLTGEESPKQTFRHLRVLSQLGVTRGTLDHV